MTVKELIDKLQSLPPKYQNLPINVFDDGSNGYVKVEVTDIELEEQSSIIIGDWY